ncbi:hypothetical protein [Streptomyces pseudogriseolus]|uniref:hypothetical protein n=1 Tax=Streptomyces pseudogriseolus TaxID=36817 RepID=UPI003FA2A469
MPLTRPAPHAGRPPTSRTAPGTADEPAGAARSAARLEELLGDPRDPANPYGRSALWAAGPGTLPVPPPGLPGAADVRGADQLVRALRPLFRRDLALAHAWSLRPLLNAPAPHPAAELFGPAALLAAAGGALRGVTRVVEGLGRYETAARQWQPVLSSLFAELLACESLTAVALRSRSGPDADGPGSPGRDGDPLTGVVGYLVPQLVGELLDDLELVLGECGFDDGTVERRTLDRIRRDRTLVRADRAAVGAARKRVVDGLGEVGAARPDGGAECAALFRITEPAPAPAPGTDCLRAVTATLAGATARAAGSGDASTAALAALGRRLAAQQRALRVACSVTAVHDPADPAALALADRQALLTSAAAVLGVREEAAGARQSFLGRAAWALLALGRITRRLGHPLPDGAPGPQPEVWAELVRRAATGVDCDLHATRLRW